MIFPLRLYLLGLLATIIIVIPTTILYNLEIKKGNVPKREPGWVIRIIIETLAWPFLWIEMIKLAWKGNFDKYD